MTDDEVTGDGATGDAAGDKAQSGALTGDTANRHTVVQPDAGVSAAEVAGVKPWSILRGLAVSGFLLALPGCLLPLWGVHLTMDYGTAANLFACLGVGLAAGAWLGMQLLEKHRPEKLLASGSFLGALSVLMISLGAPPAAVWYQSLALLITGIAAGLLNTSIFECLAETWESDPAGISLLGGIFLGGGSAFAAWLLSRCIDSASAPRLLALAALLPAAAGWLFSRMPLTRLNRGSLPIAEAVKDLRSVLAILFALLLFFQFASEWSIAGWLPIFLIDRLGLSPESALLLLMFYWLALTAGRGVTARLLRRVRHGRLLSVSALSALSGCIALLAANSTMGAVLGVLLIGTGFSAIYPLAAERIATRFTYYHPGYFNGIFTFAMLGGIFAPFLVGHLAAWGGLRLIPILAMFSSCMVFALVLLIWLGRKVSGS